MYGQLRMMCHIAGNSDKWDVILSYLSVTFGIIYTGFPLKGLCFPDSVRLLPVQCALPHDSGLHTGAGPLTTCDT